MGLVMNYLLWILKFTLIVLGLAVALGPMFRQRREIAELKRRLSEFAPRESRTGTGMTKAQDGRRDGN